MDIVQELLTQIKFISNFFENIIPEAEDESFISLLISGKLDFLYDKYFSFINDYIDDPKLIEILDPDKLDETELESIYSTISYLFPKDFYHKLISTYHNNPKVINSILIYSKEDIDFLKSLGYSEENIISAHGYEAPKEVTEYLYSLRNDESFYNYLLENHLNKCLFIVINELKKDNTSVLKSYLRTFYASEALTELLEELIYVDLPNIDEVLEKLVLLSHSSNYSVITDKEVSLKLIDKYGSKILRFIDNPDEEIISKIDHYNLEDYMLEDASYKDSPYLLKLLLEQGDYEALFYARRDAITSEIIDYLVSNNIDIKNYEYSDMRSSPMISTLVYNKYLVSKGDYSCIGYLDNFYNDLDTFNFLYDCLSKSPDNSYKFKTINYLLGREKEPNLTFVEISKEVAQRIVELGFTFDKYLEFDVRCNSLLEVYLEQGNKEALLLMTNKDEEQLQEASYDNLKLLLSKSSKVEIDVATAVKFIKEGHYDAIKYTSKISQEFVIRRLGLEDISDEEYYSLPKELQEVDFLKDKHILPSIDEVRKRLAEYPDEACVTVAARIDMPFEELIDYIEKSYFRSVMSSQVVIKYLREGHREAMKYATGHTYKDNFKEAVEEFYNLTDGAIPTEEEWKAFSFDLQYEFYNVYFSHKKYEIGSVTTHLFLPDQCKQVLKDNNYSLEDFIITPIFNGDIINRFITEDNIDTIIEVTENKNGLIYDGNSLLLNIYRQGLPKDKIKRLSKSLYLDYNRLLIDLNKDEVDIVNYINIEEALRDPKVLSLLIDNIDPTQVEAILKTQIYINDTSLQTLVDGMVKKEQYQFIKYYKYSGNEKVVKKAVLAGYTPTPHEIETSSYLSKTLVELKFNPQEKETIFDKLKTNPRYIIYCLDDFKDDKEVIYETVLKEPDIITILPKEYQEDVDLLLKLVVDSPYLVSKYYSNLNDEDKQRIVIENPEIIKYLNIYEMNIEFINLVIKDFPQVIDYYSYLSRDTIEEAFNNGYSITSDSKRDIIRYALEYGKEVPQDIWSMDNINTFIFSITKEGYEKSNIVINKILDNVYQESKEKLIAQIIHYNQSLGLEVLETLLERYNYTLDDYYQVANISEPDRIEFILKLKELDNLSSEEQLNRITELLNTTEYTEDCLRWLINHNFGEYASLYSKNNYQKKPLLFVQYIYEEHKDTDFIETTKKLIDDDIDANYYLYSYSSKVLDSKERILKILEKDPSVYYSISEEYKLDYDISKAFVLKSVYNITSIPKTIENYEQLCFEVLEVNGELFSLVDFWKSDSEALKIAIKTYPQALSSANIEAITDEVINEIDEIDKIPLESLDISIVKRIIELDSFDINDGNLVERTLEIISKHLDEFQLTNKVSNIIISLVNNNPDLIYKKYFSIYSAVDDRFLTEEQIQERNNANSLLEAYGKVNTLDKNPVFSYDLVKYVYPSLGEENTMNLMKYNSGADKELIEIIKQEDQALANAYFALIKEHRIFNNDDKIIHFAFRYFSKYKTLIENIINTELSQQEIINLTKVIMNNNIYGITTKEELIHYDEVVDKYAKDMLVSTNTNQLKNFLANTFGYNDLSSLKSFFTNHQLDNFAQINEIFRKLETTLSEEQINSLRYTDIEVKVILLIKEIIETDNVDELHRLIEINTDKENHIFDYSDIVNSITLKVRRIYNAEFNYDLSKVKSLTSKRSNETSTITDYQGEEKEVSFEIIDMDEEPFNFLVHRIYHYDAKMNGLFEMIKKDPSLWTKLDGASTISTSSISDKGFWMLNAQDPSGIIYIFDTLPDDFMLFMYGKDLYVEHGGHKLEPTSNSNCYMDIESLNQSTASNHHASYNEVAGYRSGMMPSAILCNGPYPTEEQIRAADYFKIPIIRFDIRKYDEAKQRKYDEAKDRLKDISTKEDIHNIIYNGLRSERLEDSIDYCINCIRNSYKSRKITINDMLKQLIELRRLVNKVSEPNNKKAMRKVELLIQTIALERRLTESEIIDIEEANLGESGIMYKEVIDEQTYLLKPAVDKQYLENQSFRAEIQKSASLLQKIISPDTSVEVEVIGNNKLRLSRQEKIELGSDSHALEDFVSGKELDPKYARQLLQEYIVDFLLCNFDCFSGNFIIDSDDNIRGVDKEQSFRFIDNKETLNPDFSYIPNGSSRIPIYKILFERYKQGTQDLDFTIFDEKIKILEDISDAEYKEIFRPYAEALNKDKAEEILDKILDRKIKCTELMKEYINSIRKDKTILEGEFK